MATIEKLGPVRFRGMLTIRNVSAISFWKERTLGVTTKSRKAGNVVQTFEKDGDDFCAVSNGLIK
jgi:hypothetical protein